MWISAKNFYLGVCYMLADNFEFLFRTLIYFAFSVSIYTMSVRVKIHPKWEDRIVTTVK